MTNRIIHVCAHGILGLDIVAGAAPGPEAVPEPSRDLLTRARAGWERFIDSVEERSDD